MGILIEHYEGRFPSWLSPIQVAITTIVSEVEDYSKKIEKEFRNKGIRTIIDTRNEKINYKIREHSHNKVPFILVIGKKEKGNNTVTLRRLGSSDQETLQSNDCLKKIINETVPPDLKE